MIKFIFILQFVSSFVFAVCPVIADKTTKSIISSSVSKLCANKKFLECKRAGNYYSCEGMSDFMQKLEDVFPKSAECTRPALFGNICGQNWGMAIACRCDKAAADLEAPFYRFNCFSDDYKQQHCNRELPAKIDDMTVDSSIFGKMINEKCKFTGEIIEREVFSAETWRYLTDPYTDCVQNLLVANPSSDNCETVLKYSSHGGEISDMCWALAASKSNDKKNCEKINNGFLKQKCIKAFIENTFTKCNQVVSGNDPNLVVCAAFKSTITKKDMCKDLPTANEKNKCYFELAEQADDPFYCLNIVKAYPDLSEFISASSCIEKIAIKSKNKSICDLIKNPSKNKVCRNRVN